MASHPLLDFIRRLRRARSVTAGAHLTDAQLLERFAKQRDEAAFEVLVWRHGTMVLNVAQRLLRQVADAEDVFQAAFLTLARKASSIRRGTSVGSWLYKVTYRLALRARQSTLRRERREQLGIDSAIAPDERGDAELSAVLAQEIDRLPERYRAVVVLCYLQGTTTEEASQLLGCPRGTVLSRLASARQRLRNRLVRRGIAPAVALAALSFGEGTSAAPAVTLVVRVVGASLEFTARGAAVPMVSPHATELAKGALRTMMWNKIKMVAASLCVIALVGTGSGWLARGRNTVETPLPAAEPQVKKDGLPAEAPDRWANLQKAIDVITVKLAKLTANEDEEERAINEELLVTRLRLTVIQDELRLWEQKWNLEYQQIQERFKVVSSNIDRLSEEKRDLVANKAKERLEGLQAAITRLNDLLNEINKRRQDLEQNRLNEMRHFRKGEIEAENLLRRIEARHERNRELRAIERQALLSRLEQLEWQKLGLEPADRLRDVERKLDGLRREVGELRRSLERQGKDSRK